MLIMLTTQASGLRMAGGGWVGALRTHDQPLNFIQRLGSFILLGLKKKTFNLFL